MALVDDPEITLEYVNYAFSFCDESEINLVLFKDYFINDIKEEKIDGGNLSQAKTQECKHIYSSESETENGFAPTSQKDKKEQKIASIKRLHWKDDIKVTEKDKNEIINFKELKPKAVVKSQLSNLLMTEIHRTSPFKAYSACADPDLKINSSKIFSVHVSFEKNGEPLKKKVVVKEDTLVSEMIGYVLFLCQTEDFRMKIKQNLNEYIVTSLDESLMGIDNTPIPHQNRVKDVTCYNLLIQYEPEDVTVLVILCLKISNRQFESPQISVNLNSTVKDIVVKYLTSKNMRSDGGYDVFIKSNRMFINEIDTPLESFKEFVNENNILYLEVVFYDIVKFNDNKQKSQDSSTFDLFKHVFIVQKFKTAFEVSIAIDNSKVEIIPLHNTKSLFGKAKNISIPSSQLVLCHVKPFKSSTKKRISLVYDDKDAQRKLKIEAAHYIIEEINQKINDIIGEQKKKSTRD